MATAEAVTPRAATRLSRAAAAVRAEPLLVGIVAVAAVLRLATLGQQSYWLDEAFTVSLVRQPFPEMLRYLTHTEATPPLYYMVAWVWAQPFGTTEVALRSLSAVIGIATVPMLFAAGKAFASRRAGLIAAALAATSPLMIWYSQEARAYCLLVLLGAASLYFFARSLDEPTRANLGGFAAVSVLALLTHYLAALLFAAEAVVLLWRPSSRRGTLWVIGAFAGVGLALVPLAHSQHPDVRTQYHATSLVERAKELADEFIFGRASYHNVDAFFWPSLAIVAVLAGLVAFVLTRQERRRALLAFGLALGVIVPALVLHFAGPRFDYFHYRPLIQAWLPASIGTALVLAARRLGRVGVALTVLACVLSLGAEAAIVHNKRLQREDWRDVMALVGSRRADRAILMFPWVPTSASEYYRPTVVMPRAGSPVTEVDMIIEFTRTPVVVDEQHRPIVAPQGFRLVERRRVQAFEFSRFMASRPTLVTKSEVVKKYAGFASVRLDRAPAHLPPPTRVNG